LTKIDNELYCYSNEFHSHLPFDRLWINTVSVLLCSGRKWYVAPVERKLKWNGNIFLFTHLKEHLKPYIKLFYRFFISCLLLQIFWLKGIKCPPSLIFVDMHGTSQQGSRKIFIQTNTNHLYSKLYSVCPSKYQDHSKPLKHDLPINIWSAMNTFIWLIPVVASPKLPLMRSKMYRRWRTSHYFKWKYFKN
jgi:hypothetical protein